MKKIVLAVLGAGLFLIPQIGMADSTTLYGKFRYSVNSVDDVTGSGTDGLTGTDNVSLFGLKGKYGDDVKAFFHLQTGANADAAAGTAFAQRFYFGGIESALGTIKVGRMTNAYKMPGFKLDPFYNTAGINAAGSFAAGGATYGLSPATNGFTDNAIEYKTPKIADMITVNAGVYIDDSNADDHGSTAGVAFNKAGITAGIQVAKNADTVATVPGIATDGSATRAYASYKAEKFSVGASYEKVETSATLEPAYIYVTGTYSITEKTAVTASVGSVDEGAAEGTGATVAVFQTVAPKTKAFVLYSQASLDAVGKEDPSTISIGLFHNFGATF